MVGIEQVSPNTNYIQTAVQKNATRPQQNVVANTSPEAASIEGKQQPKVDTFESSSAKAPNNEVKKSKSLKGGIANIWKFFATTSQMISSTAKGIVYGAATGATLLAGSWLFKSLPKAFTKEGPTLWNTIRHPLKNMGKSGKIIAAVGSAIVLGYHLIKGKLEANHKTADVDHRLKTGHRS